MRNFRPSLAHHESRGNQQEDENQNSSPKKQIANDLIVLKHVYHAKHGPPIMLNKIASKKRKLPGPGISSINTDIDQIVA